jgi:anti-sigma B factor antagonist
VESVVDLQVAIRESGDVVILDLRGRSTIGCGGELLSSNLQKLVADGKRKLLLNLTDLTQIDSSGLGIIVRSYVSLRQKGGDLKLLCPWGRVLQVLNVLRLLNLIPSFEDETQALASFRPQGHFAKP